MKNQHPNFCRQFLKQYEPIGNPNSSLKDLDSIVARANQSAFHLATDSHKFLLPHGGRVIDDSELKALDDTVPLRLPYPSIALEYFEYTPIVADEVVSTKRIIFVTEYEDMILILPVPFIEKFSQWMPFPEIAISLTGYLGNPRIVNGRAKINFVKQHESLPDSDYVDELSVLLGFLNALQCTNVHISRSPANKAKAKSALQFDDYHVLEIDVPSTSLRAAASGGTHRSPREHLRRGHIRRLETGRKIWVNAAVIGAGKGAGKITKDYRVN